MRVPARVVVCFAIALALPALSLRSASASLQSPTATLTGRVVDPNKSLVVRARVDAINEDTNVVSSTETNAEGFFVLPNLPTGRYRITVAKEGFRTIVKPDVELHVQDVVSINFTMDLGSVIQSITMEPGAPPVQNGSAAVGTLIDRQFVENLPLNGRSFQSLIELTPGVVLTKATAINQGQFSANGQRADSNYFTVDGVAANISVVTGGSFGQVSDGSLPGLSVAGGTNNLVSVDALQEFKIQTSTYAAEFGRQPGAHVQIVTRSGTNAFRGTLFEYLRNDVLDANNWFANAAGKAKPAERQNDFGGVLGGPLAKDRTFFFVSYEGLRLRQPLFGITDVPSIAARQGAPSTLQPFLNAFPLPTGPAKLNPATGKPTGFAEFASGYSDPSTLDAVSIRVDHRVSHKIEIFARYSYAPSEISQRQQGFTSLNTILDTASTTQTATVGAAFAVTPAIADELRVNYSRNTGSNVNRQDNFGGATPLSDAAVFPPFASSEDAFHAFLLLGGANSTLQIGDTVHALQRQINVVDGLSWLKGSHQPKFGADYRRLSPVITTRTYGQIVQFSSIGTGLPAPPPGSVFSGKIASGQIQAGAPAAEPLFTNLSFYGQDTWRATPRLTLTYGLRWEFNPAPTSANGNDPVSLSQINDPATFDLAPRGTRLYATTYGNLAPRIGASYQLSEKNGLETVIRGGFGVFYDLNSQQTATAYAFTAFPNFANRILAAGTAFPLSSALAARVALPSEPFTPPFGNVFVSDPSLRLPYTYQWNVAVEQSFGQKQSISASYVGSAGRRLLRNEQIRTPNPKFSQFVFVETNNATSDYNALQLQYKRRLARGLQALASYTWAKAIDTASDDSTGGALSTRIDPGLDRGPADFDVRHTVTAAVTYNLPFPKAGAPGRVFFDGWWLDSIFLARSAAPVNIVYSSPDPVLGQVNLRPDLVPAIPLYIQDPTAAGGRRINPAAFDQATPKAAHRQGTLGRNALRGFRLSQLDLALRRQFNLSGDRNLQFRAEFFNIFNHPNFANPNSNLTTPTTFGISTAMVGTSLGSGGANGGLNPLYQVGGPRSIQLALRLQF